MSESKQFEKTEGSLNRKLTLAEISALDEDLLTCLQVSGILGADPYRIHQQAMAKPERLGFPVVCVGNRVKIPRRAFLRFMGVTP